MAFSFLAYLVISFWHILAFIVSFFVLEIFTFLYYANEESDDVTGGSTKASTTFNRE